MSALPFTADTVFAFPHGAESVTAHAVGALSLAGRTRVVLLDTAERYFIAEMVSDHSMQVVGGPFTGADALHAAECVIGGVANHRPISALVQLLAVGLVASTIAQAEGRAA